MLFPGISIFSWRGLAALVLSGLSGLVFAQAPGACPPSASVPTGPELQAARAQARDRGALWRVQRDGRTSWLYGTLHVGKLEWAVPGPRITQALQSSDVVALEIDMSDPATMAEMVQPGPALPTALPAALQARLASQQAAACLPDAHALSALHPLLQVAVLGGLDGRWIGLDPSYGVEFVLTGFAKASGRPVLGLETPAIQVRALLPDAPEQTLHLLDTMLAQLESGLSRRVLGRLAQAWADGDLETVETYEDWCECIAGDADRAALRRLNDDRNPHLADRIAALHGEGRRVFAAVGLLHMTGPKALLGLLAARGFTVERVALR